MLMIAKSLDVVVWLKLLCSAAPRTFAQLSNELGMSASEIHASVNRGAAAGLIDPRSRMPLRKPLEEYLLYGVRYAFPAKRGPVTRGIPTSYAAPPLAKHFPTQEELPPVWPDPEGSTKGYALEPLFKPIAKAVRQDSKLYMLLALVDAIRDGRARERKLAADELKAVIANAHAD
jgi:DNA-binding Lrp family transcriptional regulator